MHTYTTAIGVSTESQYWRQYQCIPSINMYLSYFSSLAVFHNITNIRYTECDHMFIIHLFNNNDPITLKIQGCFLFLND